MENVLPENHFIFLGSLLVFFSLNQRCFSKSPKLRKILRIIPVDTICSYVQRVLTFLLKLISVFALFTLSRQDILRQRVLLVCGCALLRLNNGKLFCSGTKHKLATKTFMAMRIMRMMMMMKIMMVVAMTTTSYFTLKWKQQLSLEQTSHLPPRSSLLILVNKLLLKSSRIKVTTLTFVAERGFERVGY